MSSPHANDSADPTLSARPLHRGSGCHECRRRKLKCSGSKPTCDRCVRSGTQCVYDPVEKSKVALLRDEVLMLRQKVKTLEAQIPPVASSVPSPLARLSTPSSQNTSPISTSSPGTNPSRPASNERQAYHSSQASVLASATTAPIMWRVPLSSEDQTKLLNQFIGVQHVANEYVSFPRQVNTHSDLPAARTSAFLLASHFSPTPHLHVLGSGLFDWSRHSIDESIRVAGQTANSAPMVLDAIHASSLLATWMLVNNRLMECQQTLFGAAKLAILSGLHKIHSFAVPAATDDQPPLLVSRPTSHADVKYRVGVFWQLVCLDYTAAIIMGPSVSVSLPWEECPSEVKVETVWPNFECPTQASSIVSLFKSPQAPTRETPKPIDAGALRAKAIVLLERAVRVSALWRHGSRSPSPASPRSPTTTHHNRSSSASSTASWDESIRRTIKQTDWAISSVLEQLPLGSGSADRAACLLPYTLLLCARVRLHETLSKEDRVSQVVWVQSAVAIVRLLDGMDVEAVGKTADMLLAYSWLASYMVLLHEQCFVPYHPESEHAIKIRADLEKLKKLLHVQSSCMPVIATLFKTSVDQFNSQRKPASPLVDVKMEDSAREPEEDQLAGDDD